MNSFREARDAWYMEAVKYLDQNGLCDIMIMLVGTKSDLPKRAVDGRLVKEFCQKEGLPTPIECSSLDGSNVVNVFRTLATEMLKRHKRTKKPRITHVSDSSKCC